MLKRIMIATALVFTLSACGEETTPEACPAQTGEEHLGQDTGEPGGTQVMLHIVDRLCPISGTNKFRLHKMADESMEGMHAPAMEGMNTITVQKVVATMPAMGHGTSQDPVLDSTDSRTFTVSFQMPGSWDLQVSFMDSAVGLTEQTVHFSLEVQ